MSHIVEYYNNIAEIYDIDRFANTYGRFIDEQERNVLNRLLHNQQEVILDLACGSGRLLSYATYGLDASQEMAAIAQRKFPAKTIYVANAQETGLTNSSLDTIISFHFFMHLNQDLIKSILQECSRILRTRGRIIFDIPSKKRRELLGYQSQSWHGAFSLTDQELSQLHPDFQVKRSFGILLIPVHRIPKRMRKLFTKLDFWLANSFLKEYSSYRIVELVRK